MKVLICGAGIAGPTLAYWLDRYGAEAVIVERAPALRTGGYIIDFWGAGFDVADRMRLVPEILRRGYRVREVRVVDRDGRRTSGFPADVFLSAAGGRFTSLPRGALASAIFEALAGRVETVFGETVERVEPDDDGVRVTFARRAPDRFDLVVGADGLHSHVRALVFGPEPPFERYLGYRVAAFEVAGYRPRDELVYMMYSEVGQQVARFTMRDDRTMFLFIFADPDPHGPADLAGQKACLRARFARSGWECPRILDALDGVSDLYFDRVSQIRMPADVGWTRGRVALLGDAASCISLLGGQGSSLAMVGAYLLAGELARAHWRHAEAFAQYEARFRPFIAGKQRAARRFAGAFAPASRAGLFLRNRLFDLFSLPGIARLSTGRGFTDRIALPDYAPGAPAPSGAAR